MKKALAAGGCKQYQTADNKLFFAFFQRNFSLCLFETFNVLSNQINNLSVDRSTFKFSNILQFLMKFRFDLYAKMFEALIPHTITYFLLGILILS